MLKYYVAETLRQSIPCLSCAILHKDRFPQHATDFCSFSRMQLYDQHCRLENLGNNNAIGPQLESSASALHPSSYRLANALIYRGNLGGPGRPWVVEPSNSWIYGF